MQFFFIQIGELFRILFGIERTGEELVRGDKGAEKAATGGVGAHKLKKPPLADQMHVVLWVIKANDIRFEKGIYSDIIKFVQHRAREQSELFTFLIVHMSFKVTQIRGSPKGFSIP